MIVYMIKRKLTCFDKNTILEDIHKNNIRIVNLLIIYGNQH